MRDKNLDIIFSIFLIVAALVAVLILVNGSDGSMKELPKVEIPQQSGQ